MNIITSNWDSILVVIAFIVLVIYLAKRGATKKIDEMLFYLVSEAESIFGNGTGELKYAAVVTWLYEQLPTILKILFTAKQIDGMIEEAVARMKEYLQRNEQANVTITGGNFNG